jgi:hypothetical protein
MGGGVVSICTHDELRNDKIRHLLQDPAAMATLFELIAGGQESQAGRINNANQISLVEIITFFNSCEDICFEGFDAHASIAKQALHYTEKHSKKKKRYKDQISFKQFKVFLPTMFLFAHLWHIFESTLDNDIDDKRIFKHEFLSARPKLKHMSGADFSDDITAEIWAAEFEAIDTNKNGYICFKEFCNYCTKFIVTPKHFIDEIMHETHEMYEEEECTEGETDSPIDGQEEDAPDAEATEEPEDNAAPALAAIEAAEGTVAEGAEAAAVCEEKAPDATVDATTAEADPEAELEATAPAEDAVAGDAAPA